MKIKSFKKHASEDSYHSEVNVNIYMDLSPDERNKFDVWSHNIKTKVIFDIDLESRHWGIKSAVVSIFQIEPLEIEIINQENDQIFKTLTVNIDSDKLKREYSSGQIKYIGVGAIDLWVNFDGQVDYNNSSILISQF